MTEHDLKPESDGTAGPTTSAQAAPPRRARSTLEQNSAALGDRGTSPARFLLVLGIAIVLALGATNVLGVWSLPGQSGARKEAARKAAERKEQAGKAAERDAARLKEEARKGAEREAQRQRDEIRRTAERVEAARKEVERRARETASKQPPPPPSPTVTLPRRPELPDRPPAPPVAPTPDAGTKSFRPNEIVDDARRKIDELTGRQPSAPTVPSAPSSPAPPESKRLSPDDLVDELRRKLDRQAGRSSEPQTAARQPPPPASTQPDPAPRKVSRPDHSATACRDDRSYYQAIRACDDVIKHYPHAPAPYFLRCERNRPQERRDSS
jgi:hypothetical protein